MLIEGDLAARRELDREQLWLGGIIAAGLATGVALGQPLAAGILALAICLAWRFVGFPGVFAVCLAVLALASSSIEEFKSGATDVRWVALGTLGGMAARLGPAAADHRPDLLLAGSGVLLAALALVSTAWSIDPGLTARRALAFAAWSSSLCVVVPLHAATRGERRSIVASLAVLCGVGAVAAVLTAVVSPSLARSHADGFCRVQRPAFAAQLRPAAGVDGKSPDHWHLVRAPPAVPDRLAAARAGLGPAGGGGDRRRALVVLAGRLGPARDRARVVRVVDPAPARRARRRRARGRGARGVPRRHARDEQRPHEVPPRRGAASARCSAGASRHGTRPPTSSAPLRLADYGFGTGDRLFDLSRADKQFVYFNGSNAADGYLQALVEVGPLGVLAILGVFAGGIGGAVRRREPDAWALPPRRCRLRRDRRHRERVHEPRQPIHAAHVVEPGAGGVPRADTGRERAAQGRGSARLPRATRRFVPPGSRRAPRRRGRERRSGQRPPRSRPAWRGNAERKWHPRGAGGTSRRG